MLTILFNRDSYTRSLVMVYRCKLLFVLLASLLFLPTKVNAFKVDTHLWIGQQVINDVEDDGNISVNLGNRLVTFPVAPQIKDAILNHRNEFLIGNIGPDALPDVVVGQMLMHPGITDGWKTNDWLNYLLRKSENNPLAKAFAYGYLGHAAADVFAHTYVNQYAGDIFLLRDHETLVEQRHVALEGFISSHNPPFLNVNGQDLGKPWHLVQPSEGLATFVRDNLIYDDEVIDQYHKSFASKHLVAYRNYRKAIANAADSGIWLEIDKAVLKAVASHYGYDVSSQEAEALINFMNNEVIPRVQERVDLTQEQINRLNATFDRYDAMHHDAITNSIRRINDLNSRIISLLAQRAEADKQVCQTITENICHVPPHGPCEKWYAPWPCPERVCELINKTICAVPEASVNLIRQIDAQLNGDNGLHNQLLQSVSQLRDQLVTVKNSSLDIAQRITDLGQVLTSNTSPAKALLQNWTNDLDTALAAYVNAATQSMINTMMTPNQTHSKPFDSLEPMVDWWDCYHLTLVGVPSPVGTGKCGFRGSVESVWTALENIQNLIEDAAYIAPANMAGLPSPAQIRAEIDRLKQEAIDQIRQAAINELKDILPQEVRDIVGVFSQDIDDTQLQYYFTKGDLSGKRLLMINDIAQRVRTEMYAAGDAPYDPQRFAAVYNAVVLAKLAVLDNNGLTALAQEAGVPFANDGNALFANTANIVADAFASIDGNHQWLAVAPSYPSAGGAPYRSVRRDGYPFDGYSSPAGFVPWKAEARDALFRALFKGPLSPGMEYPEDTGMPRLLLVDYPYRPCNAYPFPNSAADPASYESCPMSGTVPTVASITLNASLANAEIGTPVTITAAVAGNNPTGNVTFFDNGVNMGTVPLTNSAAVLISSSFSVGAHAITVSYSGDGSHLNATSTAVQVVIYNPPPEFDECARYRAKKMMCP